MRHKNKSQRSAWTSTQKQTLKIMAAILVVFLVLISFFSANFQNTKNSKITIHSFEFIEDKGNNLSFDDIKTDDKLVWREADDLQFGYSQSTYWVRFKSDSFLKEFTIKSTSDSSLFLSVFNTTVERLNLYVKQVDKEHHNYRSGWNYNYSETSDEKFIYPIFQLPKNIDDTSYVYVEAYSPYSANYSISVFDEPEFKDTIINVVTIIIFMSGMLFASGIALYIQFSSLNFKVTTFYLLYLSVVIIYQLTIQGVLQLYIGSLASFLIEHVAAIGMLMIMAALQYMRVVFSTKKNYPKIDCISKIILGLSSLVVLSVILGNIYWGNLLALLMSYVSGTVMLITGIIAVKDKIYYAQFMLASWLITFLVSIVFNLRGIGILPNNEVTLFLLTLPIVVEVYLMSLGLSEMVKKQQKDNEEVTELFKQEEFKSLANETAFLQAQIKPHFLFNSLTLIETMIYQDYKKAGKLILDFATFLRHSFDFKNIDMFIPFEEEMEFINAYINIMKARFPNRLHVLFEIDDVSKLKVPPLIVQPLLENALLHGVLSKNRKGQVILRVKENLESYLIQIVDDGVGMSQQQIERALTTNDGKSKGVGLNNIAKRLQKFYSTNLDIQSELGAGTTISIKINKEGVQ